MSIQLQNAAHILEAIRTSWDAVVAPSGGDFTTIQDADDALDGAPYTLLVRPGTYAGWTTSTPNARTVLAPGVVLSSGVVLSGNAQKLLVGPGGVLQGLLTMSGIGVQVRALNGWANVGVVMSGNLGLLDGGGWGSLCDGGITREGVLVSADDCIVRRISGQTTPAGATVFDAFGTTGDRTVVSVVRVVQSDRHGILFGSGAADGLVKGSLLLGTDENGIHLNGPRNRCIANSLNGIGVNGLFAGADCDDGIFNHNIVRSAGSDSIELSGFSADGNLVTGNRLVSAVNDGGVGNSVVNNEIGAFT